MLFFYFGSIFEFIYFKKYHIFYVIFYYVVLFLNFFLTTLKYHSSKFLELKPKDEVTAVIWCLILAYFRML